MAGIKIGSVELGKLPRIVAIVDDLIPVPALKKIQSSGVSLLEIRVDLIPAGFDEIVDYTKKIKSSTGIPLIVTIRETRANRGKRLSMFERLLPWVDCIDIEIDAGICPEVVSIASDKVIMISEHDFIKTPQDKDLARIVEKATALGADIIKIAVTAKNREDVARLLQFTNSRPENMVAVAMGEIGTLSRIAAPFFGSLFTYAYIHKKVASGQLSLEETLKAFKKYYPGFHP